MLDQLEYISIFDIVSDLKREFHLSTREETEQKIFNVLAEGVEVNRKHFNILHQEYENHFTGPSKHYYIQCSCKRPIRKLYIKYKEDGNAQYGCRRCLSIRTSPRPTNKVLSLQHHITNLLTNPSKKKQQRAKEAILKHINNTLDDTTLQSAYFSLLIKEFQKTILNELIKKDSTNEVKKFSKTLLKQIREIQSIIFHNY